jgi:hypothetical protein
MRRSRSKLEVSTFPFLAVLLCAMGSLLLFLFIMDRRAKIVAQNRAAEDRPVLAARKPDTPAAQDLRQKEWEAARDKLHQLLLEEQQQLLNESQQVQNQLSANGTKLNLVQTRYLDAQQQLASETAKILALQEQVERERKGIHASDEKQNASKSELMKASQQLLEMQAAYRLLKAQRAQDKEVYSLVPYRGKRGDNRPPIYVECCRDGLVFHPQKKLMDGPGLTAPALILEIESRVGSPLLVEKAVKGKEKDRISQQERTGPYVLFLVRPEGIGNYYKALGTLRSYQLDFGYELVDEHWALDFSGTGNGSEKPMPPGITAKPSPQLPAATPLPAFPNVANSLEGSSARNGGSGNLPPLPGSVVGGTGVPSANANSGSPGNGSGGSGNVTPQQLAKFLEPVEHGIGVTTLPSGGNGGWRNSSTQGIGGVNVAPVRKPSFVPLAKNPTTIPIASTGQNPGIIASSGIPSLPGNGSSQPGSGGVGSVNGVPNPGGIAPQISNLNPAGGTAPGLNPGAMVAPVNPGLPNNGSAQPPNGNEIIRVPTAPYNFVQQGGSPNPAGQMENTGNQKGVAGSTGSNQPGSDPSGGSAANRSILPSQFGTEPSNKPAPAPALSKILGNRDFVITIDCYSDHVTMYPGGAQFRWNAQNMQAVNQSLVQSVVKLIERRQAAVRPGEPPYRPVIRFQVSTEGLRSYYYVYPLLEHLRIPMTRENVVDD